VRCTLAPRAAAIPTKIAVRCTLTTGLRMSYKDCGALHLGHLELRPSLQRLRCAAPWTPRAAAFPTKIAVRCTLTTGLRMSYKDCGALHLGHLELRPSLQRLRCAAPWHLSCGHPYKDCGALHLGHRVAHELLFRYIQYLFFYVFNIYIIFYLYIYIFTRYI
jgi:hypothetical protein